MVVECISMVRWGGSRAGDCMVAMHIVTLLSLYFSPPCTATACCYLNSWDERVRETHKKYQLKSALYMDCALCLCTFFHVNNDGKTFYKLVVLPFRGTLARYWSPTLWCFIVFTDTRVCVCVCIHLPRPQFLSYRLEILNLGQVRENRKMVFWIFWKSHFLSL